MRKWLPALPELIDRLSIVTLKSIKLNNKEEYEKEAKLIMKDIDNILRKKKIRDFGRLVRSIQIGMLANELIWANETKARAGGREQDHLLPLTHSINSLRMRAGNSIAFQTNDRKDFNTDRLVDEVCLKNGLNFKGLFEWE